MSAAEATIASATISGFVGVVIILITTRANRKGAAATEALSARANELAERVVDREDFETIVEQLRASLADVRTELAAVKRDLNTEVAARKEAEERATAAEQRAEAAERRAAAAEDRATQLEFRVTQLEQILDAEGIPVPDRPDPPPGFISSE